MEEVKNKAIEKIGNETKYSNCVFLVAKVDKVEDSEFVNCSFRKKIEIDLAERCRFENCNFVNLLIKEKKETELDKCIFPQVEGIPLEVSLASWNSEYFDFSAKNWRNLEHSKQGEYAQAYQKWYAKEKKLGVTKTIHKSGVEFAFKLIPPGKFMMGSPEDEPERYDNELLHDVILTEGFWLAETACTQELWEIVMGSNPSYFEGKQKPVEKINWDDCNEFINKINQIIPELNLCLPTEAQWEYACRAGTKTPFSFGNNIVTEQVNYNGNHPYPNGLKGICREETVDVKSLPCNNWGLYQMHGNVYEWCYDGFGNYSYDGFGNYSTENAINPIGSISSKYKVVRGGFWFDDAGYTRSAYRFRYTPGNRHFDIGFRFARGHQVSGAEGK